MAVDTIDGQRRWTVLSQQVAQPAAGADWVATVPTGVVWRVRCADFLLTTSSAVANRLVRLRFKDAAGNVLHTTQPTTAIAASQTNQEMVFAPLVTIAGPNNSPAQAPYPAWLTLPEGATIGSNTIALQTGDQFSSINLLVEQGPSL